MKEMLIENIPFLKLKKVMHKVNSVQEAFAKYFAVHLSKFEILQTTWTNKTKNIKMLSIGEKLKFKDLMFFVSFFSCYLQASFTELTLHNITETEGNTRSGFNRRIN
jgi:hypothetical protein